ncbi:hypothetical protein [Neorhizobium sp. NCHU2750]|uniref:hypothetical protein n=1 Tax=Neorhizobium sp. NCHU2750 TaxID=1825976 RepID=UPI000E744E97|nr:hypothetical protein NCHU2750_28440 [Neorhizobium sp. NCHU2750]
MILSDKLNDAIARYLCAEQQVNDLPFSIEGTPEEGEFHASIAAIEDGEHVATTAASALAALRLLQKEARAFAGSKMSEALIEGAMAYFEQIEVRSSGALNRSLEMIERFPPLAEVRGTGHLALFDALNGCIDLVGGIMERPQCGNNYRLNSAGKYLEAIQTFLMHELQRAMLSAEQGAEDEGDGKYFRLRAVLQFKASLAELSTEQLQEVIAWIDERDEGRKEA